MEHTLLSVRQSNYDVTDTCGAFRRHQGLGRALHEVVVWGGIVANCAEDGLSLVIDQNAATLESLCYCPDRTKGGVLVRPKYYQGDRFARTRMDMTSESTVL